MRITAKGQVTIPIAIREKAGLLPNTEVKFELDGDVVRLIPTRARPEQGRGERIVARLRGTASPGLSTDELMQLTRGS
jgi:AbrB family looped-hinge helix DNA binding protein